MKEYVAGFLFSTDRSQVVLVCKNKPAWQAGKLNGVGGKIESSELARIAMRREFLEEAGADVPETDWHPFCKIFVGEDVIVHFFRAFKDKVVDTMTDELVRWYNVHELRGYDKIPNLDWLIPLALDPYARYAAVCETVR